MIGPGASFIADRLGWSIHRYARRPAHPDRVGRRTAQVDDAPAHERAAISDPHRDAAAVREIPNRDMRSERPTPMRGRHGIGVEPLAAGRPFPVVAVANPVLAGYALFGGRRRT